MSMKDNFVTTLMSVVFVGIVFVFVIALIPWIGAWATVGAGSVGVVTRLGAVNRVANPGFVWKLPLIEGIHLMETRVQKEQTDASAASKDLQVVNSKVALNYHLNGQKAVEVFQNIGEEYKDRIIDPAIQEAFKAVTAKFTAENLIGNREQVKILAFNELRERLAKYDVIVDDFNIVNFDFSKDYNDAIEMKAKAQQDLEKAQIEAQAAVTNAKGQSDAQKLLKDNGGLSSEYLQFYALQKWNGILPNVTNGVPFINIPTR